MERPFDKLMTLEPWRTDVQAAHDYATTVIQQSGRENIWIEAIIYDLDGKWFVPTRVSHDKVYLKSEIGPMVNDYWEYIMHRPDDEFEDIEAILSRAGRHRSRIRDIVAEAMDPQTGSVHPDITISDHARPRPHPDGTLRPYYHWREEDLHELARGYQSVVYTRDPYRPDVKGVSRVFWREERKIVDDTRDIDWTDNGICFFEHIKSLCGGVDVKVR